MWCVLSGFFWGGLPSSHALLQQQQQQFLLMMDQEKQLGGDLPQKSQQLLAFYQGSQQQSQLVHLNAGNIAHAQATVLKYSPPEPWKCEGVLGAARRFLTGHFPLMLPVSSAGGLGTVFQYCTGCTSFYNLLYNIATVWFADES
jgi:hypothetical protein